MLRKFICLVVSALGMLLLTSPVPLRALELEPAGLSTVILPAGSISMKPVTGADLNRNGSPESLLLAGGRLTILSAGQPVWQSPAAWTVVQAAITDLNRDGTPEATLLVWRPFRPWPVDQWLPHAGRIADFHDAKGNSCQIILIGWRGSAYGELWAGSPLAEPVRFFAVADLRGDRLQELVTLEGSYTDSRSAPASALKVWEWNGFGFTVVSTMEGTFYKMALVQARDGRNLILVP
ncbi:MAG: hypothetical protein ABSA23_13460 [Anaerolineales bacterium]|jgi:hypothetical protein